MEIILYPVAGIAALVILPFLCGWVAVGVKTKSWRLHYFVDYFTRWVVGIVLCFIYIICAELGRVIVTGCN